MIKALRSIGPAVIVAAVVLGPGSILTSSKVGASFGLLGLPIVIGATILMIGMVALSARLGAVYEASLCDELASRLGRWVAVAIGCTLFALVALFQSSNNVALVGGLEPMFGNQPLPFWLRAGILLISNTLIIACLYVLQDLYRHIERWMKLLLALMAVAFLVNFMVVFASPQSDKVAMANSSLDLLPLLGMIGTTFSVGGAFYQAYLVKQKGWGLQDVQRGLTDSILSISMLGLVTAMILVTSWRVFYGSPTPVELSSVGDIARQLEPLFGSTAKLVFCMGILSGALSSFLVNALIGGTVMSDSLGKGARLEDKWPVHLTTLALLIGMFVAIASLAKEGSTVHLITLAQACTILGIPALAASLIFLGTRKELTGERSVPKWMIGLATLGLCASCLLAVVTASKVIEKLSPVFVERPNPENR
jgi:manganese transport protein